jgi:hypothetical protein
MKRALESAPVSDFSHSQPRGRKHGDPLLGTQTPEVTVRSERGDTDKAGNERIPRTTSHGMRGCQTVGLGVVILHVAQGTHYTGIRASGTGRRSRHGKIFGPHRESETFNDTFRYLPLDGSDQKGISQELLK